MNSEFALSFNNRTWMRLHPLVPPDEQLLRSLAALDGHERASFILAPLPAGKGWEDVDPWKECDTYMQAAGTSDRMTIEIRSKISDGYEHVVVGRSVPHAADATSTTKIEWDAYSTTVFENEVFAAGEAIQLFSTYLSGVGLPAGYTRRPIAVGAQ